MLLFEGVVKRNDEIEDDGKRVENLIRGILAGNIFDLGSAQVSMLTCMSFVGLHLLWNHCLCEPQSTIQYCLK
jgi:hypothetical protein